MYAFGHNTTYTNTGGRWRDVSNNLESGVTRIVASYNSFQCLKDDNTVVGIYGSSTNDGVDLSDNSINKPPSEYIIGKYQIKNIKDIFPGKYGFCAIDVSDNVICWGKKSSSYVTDIDLTKLRGGDLSGNDISANRPIAIFNNGFCWACLKEDETVITWDGTNTNLANKGSNYNDTTYGINGTYWGGNNQVVLLEVAMVQKRY